MNTPSLTEPGFKYVLNNALHNCKMIKYKHFNKLFNISLFVIFVIILAVILITKYKGKIDYTEREKRDREKKIYILSTLQKMKDINRKNSEELITNLPSF